MGKLEWDFVLVLVFVISTRTPPPLHLNPTDLPRVWIDDMYITSYWKPGSESWSGVSQKMGVYFI